MKFIAILALLNVSFISGIHFRNHNKQAVRNFGENSFGNNYGGSNNGGYNGGYNGEHRGGNGNGGDNGNNGLPLDFTANECSEGTQYCDRESTKFWACDHGKLVKLTCFPNTQCTQKGHYWIECSSY